MTWQDQVGMWGTALGLFGAAAVQASQRHYAGAVGSVVAGLGILHVHSRIVDIIGALVAAHGGGGAAGPRGMRQP